MLKNNFRMLRFIALALLASVTIAEENIEGPPFRLIKKYENEVVERQYKGGLKWACTRRYSGDSSSTQFWRLFGYILNQNDQSKKIPMTAPVSSWITKDADGTFQKDMCFFVDMEHQTNTPNPTNAKVRLVTRPQMNIFTRTVGGWKTSDDAWDEEAMEVKKLILDQGIKIKEDGYYTNGYDSPMKIFGRRNEVWWVKA